VALVVMALAASEVLVALVVLVALEGVQVWSGSQ
jgi:hypothetical protein